MSHDVRSSARGELLVIATTESTMAGLVAALNKQQVDADFAHGLTEARRVFFEQGGHRLLVLAPDLTPAVAQRIVDSLCSVDPTLAVIVFGRDLLRSDEHTRVTRVDAFHPSSRAGAGAVLKALRSL